jgi:hypothetical protein
VRRHDGRIVERVRLPLDLVDAVRCEADLRGVDFDTCAGDLVAEALPDALREAAEALLTDGRASLKHETPDVAALGASDSVISPTSSSSIVPGRRLNKVSSSNAGP